MHFRNFNNEIRTNSKKFENFFSHIFTLTMLIKTSITDEPSDIEKENQRLYYIRNEQDETKSQSTNQEVRIRPSPFVVTRVEENSSGGRIIGRKRGRERRNPNPQREGKGEQKPPRKYQRDDVLNKNQVHFMSYIILCLNCILISLGFKEEFKEIDYDIKKKVNYEFFTFLQKQTLRYVICMNISKKNKNYSLEHNKKLVEEIDNPIIQRFLDENYLSFFQNWYYAGKKVVNLKIFGKEEDCFVFISNKKNPKKPITYQEKLYSFEDIEYRRVYDKHVKENYTLQNLSFNTERYD